MKGKNIKIIAIILAGLVLFGTGVYAGTLIDSSAVSYSPEDETWNVSNVEAALDDIYSVLFPECGYNVNESWTFTYTGEVEEFEVPCKGTYKLEVWGAQGGNPVMTNGDKYTAGGKGGYAKGEVALTNGQVLNVVVGNQPQVYADGGGFNGGGSGNNHSSNIASAGGGGATHIAKKDNAGTYSTLSTYVNDSTAADYVYVVAGGGGGGAFGHNVSASGGCGGGTSGCGASGSTAGTQSGGNAFGQGGNGYSGGGGGWYGATGGTHDGNVGFRSAAGGSGHIGSVSNGETIAGNQTMPTHDGISTMTGNSGNGYAKITLVSAN